MVVSRYATFHNLRHAVDTRKPSALHTYMATDKCFAGICFVALDPTGQKFFGFSEYLAALALMVLVWTTTDIRYRFRIATAPVPLHRLTFWAVAGVGSLALLTDLWRAAGWWVPRGPLLTPETWQATLGAAFLLAFLTWAWFAYLRPPRYGPRNAQRYADFLYRTILNGSPADIATVGGEMIRSIPSLIAAVPDLPPRSRERSDHVLPPPPWRSLAHDILLLIADQRFCRSLVTASPDTIHVAFQEVSKTGKYWVPISSFGRNVVAAAIGNRDSFIYHEQSGLASGLLGYVKPLSQAIFGNYRMVEEINQLLDLDYRLMRRWSEAEWDAYCGAVLILFRSYVEEGIWSHSFTLYRAFDRIGGATDDLYKLDGLDGASWESDAISRLQVCVNFCEEALRILDGKGLPEQLRRRVREQDPPYLTTIYDHLADLMLKLILNAEAIRQSRNLSWMVRHNIVWSHLLGGLGAGGSATRIVRFKLRRKIYDEIASAEKWPNYRNTRLLGFCLHVMGLAVHDASNFGREYRPLHHAVLAWTRRNFATLHRRAPQVFEDCLPANMGYDEDECRLVKTSEVNALRNVPERTCFVLDPAKPPTSSSSSDS